MSRNCYNFVKISLVFSKSGGRKHSPHRETTPSPAKQTRPDNTKALDIPGKFDIMVSNKEHPAKATKRTRRALCVHQREPPRRAFIRAPCAASGFAPPNRATTAERGGGTGFSFLFGVGFGRTPGRSLASKQKACPETLAGTARYSRLRVTPRFARVIRVEPWAFTAHPVEDLRDGLFCISGKNKNAPA